MSDWHVITVIVQERNRRIDCGEIDIGRAICPVKHILQRGLTTKEVTVYGRVINLTRIRELHLAMMENRGLLRNSHVSGLDAIGCKTILRKHDGKLHG